VTATKEDDEKPGWVKGAISLAFVCILLMLAARLSDHRQPATVRRRR
jgi:hypothetical protein